MLFNEINTIAAPSDATFWAGVAVGTATVVGIGFVVCC